MKPHYDLADSWRTAAGQLVVCAYIVAALVFDWRPADVLAPWLGYAQIPVNLIVLYVAYRSARRIGARYGRWRQATAAGTLPTRTTRKDPTRV